MGKVIKPQNFEERLVWYFITGTYGIYLLGILLPLNACLGWLLFFYLCKKLWFQQEDTPVEKRIHIPWVLWIWVIGMSVIMIAQVVALTNFEKSTNDYIRAIMSWSISWALLALFPLVGRLHIRPQLIYRAICILCLQSLIIIPFCYLAYLVHLPHVIYSSPIERIFQNGKQYYDVSLYHYYEYNGELRLALFAPWGPALGIVGTLYFFFSLQEPDKKWRWIGIAGAVAMCVVSSSRLAFLALPGVPVFVFILTNFWRPYIQIWSGLLCFVSGIFSSVLLRTITSFKDAVLESRSDSTRVRKKLIEIAFERSKEAPIWGHGNQEPGPQMVEKMPIGSHTTWGGLMFVNGLVGFVAFLVPMLCTFITLLIEAQKSNTAKVGLSVFLVLLFFSSGESLDVLAYLCWPAWVVIGIALKQEDRQPISSVDFSKTASNLMLEQQ
ncbi:MAG TPA: O-antigen ligase family protein [Waterburya sp.]